MSRIRLIASPLLILTAVLLVGCRPAPAPPAADQPQSAGAQTSIDRGPVRVQLEVAPHPIRLSDEPTLTVTIDAQRDIDVEKPPFGESIGEFQIRGFREPLVEIRGDRHILRQIYTLEPTRSGRLSIAPISVAFTDRRPKGDGQRHTIQTEPLQLEVISVLEDEAPSLDALQPLAGPVELPEPPVARWPWLTGVAVVLGVFGLSVWLAARRRRAVAARLLSPQELAYLELQQLLAANLSESDVKLFYVQLTGLVRRYIERTTGIHAPEQTTEEFLREIGQGRAFSPDERLRLADFLASADLVKFAAHEPAAADIELTFQRAKAFLGLEGQEVSA